MPCKRRPPLHRFTNGFPRQRRSGFCICPFVPTERDPIISLFLDIVDLDDSPLFDTLSYTWGDPLNRDVDESLHPPKADRRNLVSCNGVTMPIRANLHAALRMLLT